MKTSVPCPSPRSRTAVIARRGARLASLLAGAFAMSLLAGADGCTITIEPLEKCTELDDVCPSLECEVYATNDDGCALCECADEPPPDESCFSDEDCATGEWCDLSSGGAPSSDSNDDGSSSEDAMIAPAGECRPFECPAIAPIPPQCEDGQPVVCESDVDDPCGGFCYCEDPPPPPPGGACLSDDECEAGQRCEILEVCGACPEGETCDVPCFVEGVCVDDDGSCDDGSEALCDMVPPTCEDGLVLAVQGSCFSCVDPATCEPPPPPVGCEAMLCAPDTVCAETEDGPQCVPVVEGCYSDADCGEGASCNAEEVCMPPPGCEDGAGCPDVCYGQCVEGSSDPAQ